MCLGITGCGGGDDDSPATVTTVTTNATTGVVVTNVVEVPVEPPAADPADEVAPAADEGEAGEELSEVELLMLTASHISGRWSGAYLYGYKNISMDWRIVHTGGGDLEAEVTFSGGNEGWASGSVLPDSRVILNVREKRSSNPDTWRNYHFDGSVNADGTLYSGTWQDDIDRSGTFSLHR